MPEGPPPLGGRVAILLVGPAHVDVHIDVAAVALALAGAGATVVLAGSDADEAGRILAAVEGQGRGRGAFFRLEDDGAHAAAATEALIGFVAEQFRDAPTPSPDGERAP